MVSIWYRHEHHAPEVIDRARTRHEAVRLRNEYALAFGTLPGHRRYGRDVVWAGRRDDEPRKRKDEA